MSDHFLVLVLPHGDEKTVPVVGTEDHPTGLIVRWGFLHYTYDLAADRLVRIEGNRVKKKFRWKAKDPLAALALYRKLKGIIVQ